MICNEFGNCSCPNGTVLNGTDCISNGVYALCVRFLCCLPPYLFTSVLACISSIRTRVNEHLGILGNYRYVGYNSYGIMFHTRHVERFVILCLSILETISECTTNDDCLYNMTCNEFGNCSCPNGTVFNGAHCFNNGKSMCSLLVLLK